MIDNNTQSASNQINSQEQEVKANISELNDETINTRKLQSIGIIVFGLIILILLVFKFSSIFSSSSEKVKNEASIDTKIEKKDFSLKDDSDSVKNFKELVLEEDISSSNKKPLTEPDDDKDVFKATLNNSYQPKVYKGSSSLLAKSIPINEEHGSKTTTFNDPTLNYDVDKITQMVQNAAAEPDKENYELDAFTPKVARLNKYDPNLLLPKGTYIGCSLNTKLVSTIKGSISCTVSENIYSQNGNTLLIEKGSKITGFFNSGQVNDGMNRIFVVWQEIRTPNNIDIPVSSGATDELGGSGIEGYIDHHWLKRFGASILLSVIDDAMNVVLNGGVGNKNNDYTENTRQSTREMANTALEKFINIQPTLYKNHGDLVAVYVNRDIDFSQVYKLKFVGKKIIK